jgi:hypothetical protein
MESKKGDNKTVEKSAAAFNTIETQGGEKRT